MAKMKRHSLSYYEALATAKIKEYDKEKENYNFLLENKEKIIITLNGFWNAENIFTDITQIATLVIISSFCTTEKESDFIKGYRISLQMILDRFNFKQNKTDKKKRICESIQFLIDNDIISIIHKDGLVTEINNISTKDLFTIRQHNIKSESNENGDKIFYYITWSELETILNSSHNDNTKINLIGVFATMASDMIDYKTKSYVNEWQQLNHYKSSVLFKSRESIATKSNIGTKQLKVYIKELINMGLICQERVHRIYSNGQKWNFYYSRRSDYYVLISFIVLLLSHGFPYNNGNREDAEKYIDYSYLNLNDWDSEGYVLLKNKDNKVFLRVDKEAEQSDIISNS